LRVDLEVPNRGVRVQLSRIEESVNFGATYSYASKNYIRFRVKSVIQISIIF